MNNDVCITIVIAVRNMAATIERTIKSVLDQAYANKELIIMDCESTDGTIDIIKKYEKNLKYWVSAPDDGPSDAISKALDYADGELIGFLGADDWYEQNALKKVSNAYESCEGDLYYGNMLIHNGNDVNIVNLREFSTEKLFNTGTQWLGAVCAFVKKELLIENYRKNNNFLLTDYLFFMRLYAENKKFVHIGDDEPITHFSIGGRTTTLIDKVALDAYEVRKQVMREYPGAWGKYEEYWIQFEREHFIDVLETRKCLWMTEDIKNTIINSNILKKNEKYILFGSGNRGRQCLEMLKWLGIDVDCFVDNDEKKCGNYIKGVPIFNVCYLSSSKYNIIITTGYKFAEQIERQLETIKYESGKIFDFSLIAFSICELIGFN